MSSPPPPPSSQAPRPRDLLGVRSLLAERDFVRIWVTGALGWTVRWLEVLSIALYALAETGSALVVALMLFVRVAPTTLLAGPFGAVADRFDRRRLLCIGLALLCLNSLVLGALAAVGVLTLWHIAIGAFLNGCVWSGEHSVRRTLLAEIVGLERLGRATSLDSATNQATRMIGPLIGGLLFGLLGLQGAYFIGAILFAIAFFNVARLDTEVRIATGPAIGLLSSIREGLSHVRANRPVAATLAVTIIMNLFGFPYFSMIPVIGERVLDLSAAGIGLLMSLDGLGATLGSVALAIFIRPRLYLPVYLAGAFLLMATIVGFGGSPWLELSAPNPVPRRHRFRRLWCNAKCDLAQPHTGSVARPRDGSACGVHRHRAHRAVAHRASRGMVGGVGRGDDQRVRRPARVGGRELVLAGAAPLRRELMSIRTELERLSQRMPRKFGKSECGTY